MSLKNLSVLRILNFLITVERFELMFFFNFIKSSLILYLHSLSAKEFGIGIATCLLRPYFRTVLDLVHLQVLIAPEQENL